MAVRADGGYTLLGYWIVEEKTLFSVSLTFLERQGGKTDHFPYQRRRMFHSAVVLAWASAASLAFVLCLFTRVQLGSGRVLPGGGKSRGNRSVREVSHKRLNRIESLSIPDCSAQKGLTCVLGKEHKGWCLLLEVVWSPSVLCVGREGLPQHHRGPGSFALPFQMLAG